MVVTSAGPNKRPRSEGLIGEASTFISTSSSLGYGTSCSCIDSSSLASSVINDLICLLVFIFIPLFYC